MSAFPAAIASNAPVAAFDDDAWKDLLNSVEEKPRHPDRRPGRPIPAAVLRPMRRLDETLATPSD